VASIVAGSSLTFTVTAGGGTSPYAYAVVATNNATGATTVLGSNATGSFTPQTAGTSYNIDATVTDATGKVAQALTRTVQVTAAQTVNQLPVANAGQDLTITLPTSSAVLMGTASDPDAGDTLTYAWRQITGPNSATGLPATSLNVVASNLVAGTYQFGFQATDQAGGKSSEDFVVVTVNAAVVVLTQMGLRINTARQASLYPAAAVSDYAYSFAALPAPLTALVYSVPASAVKVSSIPGLVSDADISEGSTTYGTDQTALIQQFLDNGSATATASAPFLVDWDVAVSTTGFKYHSNNKIYARPNCGAIMRGSPGSQGTKAVWENFNSRNFSLRDSNCGIYNGIWNHNGFSGTTAPTADSDFNQVHSSNTIGWNCAIRVYNVDGFEMWCATILRQRTFAIHAINTTGLVLKNGVINAGSSGAALNTDGPHLNFSHTNFIIDNWQINSHDDKVAISVNDSLDRDVRGGNSTYYLPYYQGKTPLIDGGTVSNIEFTGGILGLRVLSGANQVRNVSFKGIYGSTAGPWLIMDNFWQSPNFDGAGPGYVSNITFDEIYVNSMASGVSFPINECGANINCNATGITFKNVNSNLFSQSGKPMLAITGANTVVSGINVENYQGHDLDSNSFQNSHILIRDASVDGLHVTGTRVSRLSAPDGNYLVEQQSGNLKNLTFNDVQVDGLASLFKQSGGTYTGTVTADNVYHTNAGAGNGSFYATVTPGPKIAATNTTTQQLLQGTSTN
jgi:hypothetical protein